MSPLVPVPPAKPRRQPNKSRDLAIFRKVAIEHFTLEEAGHCYHLRKSRVGEIVARIRRELAEADPDDPAVELPAAQDRLDARLERLRLEYALEATTKALLAGPDAQATCRKGSRDKGGKAEHWNEEVTRLQPNRVQLLKLHVRITDQLAQLRRREEDPIPDHVRQDDLLKAIREALNRWLADAQRVRRPPSDEFQKHIRQFCNALQLYAQRRGMGFCPAESWPIPPPPTKAAVSAPPLARTLAAQALPAVDGLPIVEAQQPSSSANPGTPEANPGRTPEFKTMTIVPVNVSRGGS